MMPTNENVAETFIREAQVQLAKATEIIRHCLDQLTDQQLAWRPQESMNSIGNLVLHLCGNVHQWIVSGVGGQPDVRNRPCEFADKDPFAKADIVGLLDGTVVATSPPRRQQPRAQPQLLPRVFQIAELAREVGCQALSCHRGRQGVYLLPEHWKRIRRVDRLRGGLH